MTILSDDRLKVLCLFIYLCFQPIYDFLSFFFPRELAHIFIIFLAYAPLLYLLVKSFDRYLDCDRVFPVMLAPVIFGVFLLYMVTVGRDNPWFASYAIPSIISFFSGITGFYFFVIQDDSVLVRSVLKCVALILVVYLTFFYDPYSAESYVYGYDMYTGYRLLFPSLLCLYFAFFCKDVTDCVEKLCWFGMFMVGILHIIAYGSRGPIIGVICFLMIRFMITFFSSRRQSRRRKHLYAFLTVFGICFFWIFSEELFNLSYGWFLSYDVNSRTLRRLVEGTMMFDNGRIALLEYFFSQLNLWGYGPFGDQFLLGEGNYTHNFFLEILFDFGILFGGVVLFLLGYYLVKVFLYRSNSPWFDLFVVFLSFNTMLLNSGTFWKTTYFWMLIAIGYLCLQHPVDEEEKISLYH